MALKQLKFNLQDLMKHKQTLIGNIIQPIEFAESAFILFGDQVETGEILLIDACWSVPKVCKK